MEQLNSGSDTMANTGINSMVKEASLFQGFIATPTGKGISLPSALLKVSSLKFQMEPLAGRFAYNKK